MALFVELCHLSSPVIRWTKTFIVVGHHEAWMVPDSFSVFFEGSSEESNGPPRSYSDHHKTIIYSKPD